MAVTKKSSNASMISRAAVVLVTLAFLVLAVQVLAKDKKPKNVDSSTEIAAAKRQLLEGIDKSKIVWPNPPAIARIRYLNFWVGEKFVDTSTATKKKSSWMERVSGVAVGEAAAKQRWSLLVPNGVAADSKDRIYVADSKVRAIFVVDSETGDYTMIKNGVDAKFQWLTAIAIDDADRLFTADSGMHRVLIFDSNKKVEGQITEGIYDPSGIAIDNENRMIYIADAEQDVVNVYDVDPPYKKIRTLGKSGTKHTSTVPGEFAKPTGLTVDKDGNLYVADTWNDRVEVFDADGNFIRTFGKAGDGPGYFARPKGIAIDADGHVWVADTVQARVQVFTAEGRLLIYMGESGQLPGQFQGLVNIAIDKNNRVMTTEQYPGRLQIFRYVTDEQAKAEKDRRDAETKQKIEEKRGTKVSSEGPKPAVTDKK